MANTNDADFDFSGDEPSGVESEVLDADGSRDPTSGEPEHVKFSRTCNCPKCVARRGFRGDGGSTDRRTRPSSKGNKLDIDAFARQLMGAHVIAFTLLSNPLGADVAKHILIEEKEAKELAKTIGEVLQHYSISIDPKTQAILALVFTAGIIYLPKLGRIASAMRTKSARQSQQPMRQPFVAVKNTNPTAQTTQSTVATGTEVPITKDNSRVVNFNEYDP